MLKKLVPRTEHGFCLCGSVSFTFVVCYTKTYYFFFFYNILNVRNDSDGCSKRNFAGKTGGGAKCDFGVVIDVAT